MIKLFYGFFLIASEEVVDRPHREVHLNNLVFAEVNEIGVTCDAELHLITLYFAVHLQTEVLEDPANLYRLQIPFQVAQNYEIIHPGIPVLEEPSQHIFFD